MPAMFRKDFIIGVLLSALVACGNPGNLYLSDEDRIRQSKDEQEISRLQARVKKFKELHKETLLLKNEISALRKVGRQAEANAKYIKYKELRLQMGQILIERQQEAKYGNI